MTEQQVFQLFGLAYLAVGLGAVLNPHYYRNLIANYLHSQATLYLSGFLAIFIGFLLTTYPFDSTSDFNWILKALGWVSLLKGALVIILPKTYIDMVRSIKGSTLMGMEILFAVVLGVLMLYIGYMQ